MQLQPPPIIYVASALHAAPAVAWLMLARARTPARTCIAAWCAWYVAANQFARWVARHGDNNLWVGYVVVPIGGALLLWGLSLWQPRQLPRLTLRLMIPLFLAAWITLTLLIENTRTFSVAAEPVYSLLALGASLFTLVSRSADATSPLVREDWFWICAGLALYFTIMATLIPLSSWLLATGNLPLIHRAYVVKAWLSVLSWIALTIGMLCPTPPTPSPVSSSPAPSV